jgi:hypothetical protein
MRTGDAGAGTDVTEECRIRAPKRAGGVAEFSLRSVSAESRLAAPGACVGSVGCLRCVALLRAVWCGCVMRTQAGPTVYGA